MDPKLSADAELYIKYFYYLELLLRLGVKRVNLYKED